MRASTLALLLCGCAATRTATPPAAPTPPPKFRLGDAVRPLRYAATLAVDPDAERFSGTITIDVRLASRTRVIWLNARNLTIEQATAAASGETLAATTRLENPGLLGVVLPRELGPGDAQLTVRYTGAITSTDLAGIFRQQAGGAWYAYTGPFPADARSIYPCFDEPSFKVPWQLTLEVPQGLTAASNTPAQSEETKGPLRVVHFAPTRPLPSYLVAFVVGPFDRVDLGTWGRRHTPVQALVEKGRGGELGMAKEIIGPGLERLESWFDLPYAYGKLDFVSVPRFFGAMENPGLITINATWLLAKPEAVTPPSVRACASVAVHEMAHQWFGDLVTMRWWDDLWLNESFADWLADQVLATWHPDWEREVLRISGSRAGAMAADSLATAPAIRRPVTSPEDVGSGDSDITYSKGDELLWMTQGWLGAAPFQAGIRRYIAAHADANATATDLFSALGAASGKDVGPVLSTFLDQSGIPLVAADLRCASGAPPALHLAQRRYLWLGQRLPDERRWKVPLCVRYPTRSGAIARACTVLDASVQELALAEARACPAWVVANERAGLLGDLFALVVSGDVPAAEALAQVPAAVKSGDPHQVTEAAGFVDRLSRTAVTEDLRPRFVRMVRQAFGPPARALGLVPKPGEGEGAKLLRDVVLDAAVRLGEDAALKQEARRLAVAWVKDHAAVPREVAERALYLASRDGDAALHDLLFDAALRAQDGGELRTFLKALGGFHGDAQVQRNLDLLLATRVDMRVAYRPIIRGAGDEPRSHALAYAFVKAHWDELAARLPKSMAAELLFSAPAGFCDAALRQAVEADLDPRAAQIFDGPPRLQWALAKIDACIATRERQRDSAATFLQRY